MEEMKIKDRLSIASFYTASFQIFLSILPDLVFLKAAPPEGKWLEMRRAGWNALRGSICFRFREMPATVIWVVSAALSKKVLFFLLGNADLLKFKPFNNCDSFERSSQVQTTIIGHQIKGIPKRSCLEKLLWGMHLLICDYTTNKTRI